MIAQGPAAHEDPEERGTYNAKDIPENILDGKLPADRHIEVKSRVKGADTVTISGNALGFLDEQNFNRASQVLAGASLA